MLQKYITSNKSYFHSIPGKEITRLHLQSVQNGLHLRHLSIILNECTVVKRSTSERYKTFLHDPCRRSTEESSDHSGSVERANRWALLNFLYKNIFGRNRGGQNNEAVFSQLVKYFVTQSFKNPFLQSWKISSKYQGNEEINS